MLVEDVHTLPDVRPEVPLEHRMLSLEVPLEQRCLWSTERCVLVTALSWSSPAGVDHQPHQQITVQTRYSNRNKRYTAKCSAMGQSPRFNTDSEEQNKTG